METTLKGQCPWCMVEITVRAEGPAAAANDYRVALSQHLQTCLVRLERGEPYGMGCVPVDLRQTNLR